MLSAAVYELWEQRKPKNDTFILETLKVPYVLEYRIIRMISIARLPGLHVRERESVVYWY